MKYNYHIHTFRCHHATGTEREYVEKSILAGLQKIGFSEHVPYIEPDGSEEIHRLYTDEIQDYVNTILALKEEYKDKIEIHLGYEMENIPGKIQQIAKDAKKNGIEYLILGQHFVGYGSKEFLWSVFGSEKESSLVDYADLVIEAIESGYITYVCHPDMFNFTGDDAIYDREMRRICKAAKNNNIPLEINFLGIRTKRKYPNEKFWKIAGEVGNDVVFGLDAHDVDGAGDTASKVRAEEIIKKYNLHYIEDLKLNIL